MLRSQPELNDRYDVSWMDEIPSRTASWILYQAFWKRKGVGRLANAKLRALKRVRESESGSLTGVRFERQSGKKESSSQWRPLLEKLIVSAYSVTRSPQRQACGFETPHREGVKKIKLVCGGVHHLNPNTLLDFLCNLLFLQENFPWFSLGAFWGVTKGKMNPSIRR